ncbi:MAG: octanoyltransferase [Verrucomicrobia bacterium]|nr:octanoyltransferase [Verrucomicrobiota bacterium]
MSGDSPALFMARILQRVDLGRMAYAPALKLQEWLVGERQAGRRPDILVLVEHDPVYTLGRNAREENLLAGDDFLARKGIKVFRTGRGGDITYHGPGQLVGYPIIDLRDHGLTVVSYVARLESLISCVLAEYGLASQTDRRNRGVWIGNEKIAAIGVRIARYVTMHGFALNVTTDLENYAGIVPCGIRDKGVTSLNKFSGNITMAAAGQAVAKHFIDLFRYDSTVEIAPAALLKEAGV